MADEYTPVVMNALVEKTTIAVTDAVLLEDSEDSDAWKKLLLVWDISRINNGAIAYYRATADTNAARGVALSLAVSEASSGDKIHIRAGTYDCNDLFVSGVYYYFEDGAIIDYTGSVKVALFENKTATDAIIYIDGYGSFRNRGNAGNHKNIFQFAENGTITGRIIANDLTSDLGLVFYGAVGGELFIKFNTSVSDVFFDIFNGIDVTIIGNKITAAEAIDIDSAVAGTLNIYVNKIIATSEDSAITIGGGGDGATNRINVYNSVITSSAGAISDAQVTSGGVYFYNCIFSSFKDYEFEDAGVTLYNCNNVGGGIIKSFYGDVRQLTDSILSLNELSADPSDPAEGCSVMWQSDGTGAGGDGDIMMKITAGGVTKTITLADFSEL